MIDKWFREDMEKVLKTKNRVVIAAEDENADFLYGLIPDHYKPRAIIQISRKTGLFHIAELVKFGL